MKNAAIWLLAVCFLACAVNDKQPAPLAAATPVNVKNATVTLQIFSGRENPSWSLSEKQIDELLALLKDLPQAEPRDFPDGLGYRGFQVVLTENTKKKTHEIVVYQGQILYETAEAKTYLADRDRRLEKFLLKTGESHLDDALSKSVSDEIKSPVN
jgi:hypothetical protein